MNAPAVTITVTERGFDLGRFDLVFDRPSAPYVQQIRFEAHSFTQAQVDATLALVATLDPSDDLYRARVYAISRGKGGHVLVYPSNRRYSSGTIHTPTCGSVVRTCNSGNGGFHVFDVDPSTALTRHKGTGNPPPVVCQRCCKDVVLGGAS